MTDAADQLATINDPNLPSRVIDGTLCTSRAGIAYLATDAWIRAFLAVGVLYLTTSAFTLAKVVRDRQEEGQVVNRVDEARMERLMAEYDPLRKEH